MQVLIFFFFYSYWKLQSLSFFDVLWIPDMVMNDDITKVWFIKTVYWAPQKKNSMKAKEADLVREREKRIKMLDRKLSYLQKLQNTYCCSKYMLSSNIIMTCSWLLSRVMIRRLARLLTYLQKLQSNLNIVIQNLWNSLTFSYFQTFYK